MNNSEKQINLFIGQKIRNARETLGITQESIAKELEVSFQQVQKYEKGHNRISAVKLFVLAQAIDVPVHVFFPKTESNALELIPPKTLRVIKMINQVPAEKFDDFADVIRSVLRIAANNKSRAK